MAMGEQVDDLTQRMVTIEAALANGLHAHGPVNLPIVVESLTSMRAKGDIDVAVKPGQASPPDMAAADPPDAVTIAILRRLLDRDEEVVVNPDTIRQLTQAIRADCDAIDAELGEAPIPPEPVEELVISDPSDLQPALSAGEHVALTPGLICHHGGGYNFDTSATALRGQGENTVSGDTNPALRVACGVADITIDTLTVEATAYDSVIRVGKNDTNQITVDQAPRDVTIRAIRSSGHRGKRAIEINAAHVQILDCEVRDLYAPEQAGQPGDLDWQCARAGAMSTAAISRRRVNA